MGGGGGRLLRLRRPRLRDRAQVFTDGDLDLDLATHLLREGIPDRSEIAAPYSIAMKRRRAENAQPIAMGFHAQIVDERLADEPGQFESQSAQSAIPDLRGKGHVISHWLRAR